MAVQVFVTSIVQLFDKYLCVFFWQFQSKTIGESMSSKQSIYLCTIESNMDTDRYDIHLYG